MKKILIALVLIISFAEGFSQGNDSLKYVYYRFTYGNRLARYRADTVLMIPADTLWSKDGIALRAGVFYIGNHVKWSQVSGGSSTIDSLLWTTRFKTLQDSIALATAINGKVPSTRTITINGVGQDLSANRTFTIAGTTTQSIQFAQGGSAATTYTSSTLIGQSILVIFLEGTPVDTLTKSTIYFTSDGASGTITLHNGQFAANENVIILYQSGSGGGGGSGSSPATAHKIALWMGDSIMDPNTNNTLSSVCSCSITPLGTSWVDTAKGILQLDSSFNLAVYGSFIEGGYIPAQKSWAAQTIQAIAQHPNADLIVVALGANDYTEMAHLGNYDSAMSRSTQAALDTTMIFEMLRYSMWRLTQSYPNARCYFITPFERKNVETESIQWLYDAIEKMAKRYNWKIIHGTEVGIVQDFEPVNIAGRPGRWTIDGTHLLEPAKWLVGKFVSKHILNSFITP